MYTLYTCIQKKSNNSNEKHIMYINAMVSLYKHRGFVQYAIKNY